MTSCPSPIRWSSLPIAAGRLARAGPDPRPTFRLFRRLPSSLWGRFAHVAHIARARAGARLTASAAAAPSPPRTAAQAERLLLLGRRKRLHFRPPIRHGLLDFAALRA